jgi:hypothetical protein
VTLLRHVGSFLLGLAVAVGAVAVHRSLPPLGLLLALLPTFAVPWWLLRSGRPRTAMSYAAGWLLVLGATVSGRPEGDYAVAGDLRGYGLVAAGFGLVAVAVASVANGRRGST